MNSPQKLYNVGSYIRLSKNDEFSDSQSIESQQQILSKFISIMPGWTPQKFYIDNGYGGGNFERPAFQELLADIRTGKINLFLVKDLSRFGRNYLEAGKYLEEILPSLGCRFVALMDNVDTENGENDLVPFINGLNDYYLKNQSEKIKAVLAAKAKEGHFLSGETPYGYMRDPDNHTRLIIDESIADIVRKIFEMRADGVGYYLICKQLNENEILPPRLYYYTRQNREPSKNCSQIWDVTTVKRILNNEIYVGDCVKFKLKSRSYRDKKVVKRDENEWIRIANTHEPIIEKSLWEIVQKINSAAKEKVANKRPTQEKLFAKFLVCPDCGSPFTANLSYNKRSDGSETKCVSYHCKRQMSSAGKVCTRHSISELVLKQIVMNHIKSMVEHIKLDKNKILKQLQERLIGTIKQKNPAKTKRDLEQKLHTIETQTAKLYEDKCEGIISNESFSKMITSLEEKRKTFEKELSELNQSADIQQEKLSDIQKWVRLIEEKSTITDLDRETLEALVDKIEVGEKEVVNGVKTQDVRIYYKFVGLVK